MSILFLLLIGTTALLYASVGHGGASGYLAIMAFFAFEPNVMKSTALLLNLLVAGIAFWQFHRRGYFKWRLFWPFALGSIPAAFVGGFIELPIYIFKIVLGVLLLIAVGRMLFSFEQKDSIISYSHAIAVVVGLVIGLLSGIIGIGGGILLSPVLLVLNWANLKETAAISALFIWVNSLAGLLGFFASGGSLNANLLYLIVIAGIGAIIGGYLGSFKWNTKILRTALATVLAMASIKLIFL